MIKFGIRQSFDSIEQVENRYANLNVPVEVALPYEIVSFNLPMTLDTAHIRDDKKIWELLKDYKENIKNVHLSAKGGDKQHLPIDSFCKDVVNYLIESKWDGNVILEYLFEFHDQMLSDLRSLESAVKV